MFKTKEIIHEGDMVKAPLGKYILRGTVLSIVDDIYTVEIPCYYCSDSHSIVLKLSYDEITKAK